MQEIGLAKELDKLFDEITVYKAVPMSIEKSISPIDDCEHATLYQIPVKSYGINGDWKCSLMDTNLDALIYFSDTQLVVPKVFKWCRSNNIPMYPYIGVIESHSTSQWKKAIIDFMFKRNLTVYKKCICFVKTPTVARQLAALAKYHRPSVFVDGGPPRLAVQGAEKIHERRVLDILAEWRHEWRIAKLRPDVLNLVEQLHHQGVKTDFRTAMGSFGSIDRTLESFQVGHHRTHHSARQAAA